MELLVVDAMGALHFAIETRARTGAAAAHARTADTRSHEPEIDAEEACQMNAYPIWSRMFMLAWGGFVLWLACRYEPPAGYRRTRGQRRMTAIGRPLIALVGLVILVIALWP